MDVLLFGALAVVLIALTVWVISRAPDEADAVRREDNAAMIPQGDSFEDQYTSATADLSAGGVAVTTAASEEDDDSTRVEEPLPPMATPSPAQPQPLPVHVTYPSGAADSTGNQRASKQARQIGLGAATALTLGGAAAGAWLYARWQRERNKPLSRLRRRFR